MVRAFTIDLFQEYVEPRLFIQLHKQVWNLKTKLSNEMYTPLIVSFDQNIGFGKTWSHNHSCPGGFANSLGYNAASLNNGFDGKKEKTPITEHRNAIEHLLAAAGQPSYILYLAFVNLPIPLNPYANEPSSRLFRQ